MRLGILGVSILVIVGLVFGVAVAGLPTLVTLAAIGGIVVFYLGFFHPFLILAFLLCVTPFDILWIGEGIAPLELIYGLMYVVLVVSWVVKKVLEVIFQNRTGNIFSRISLPLILFFCVTLFACVIGVSRGYRFLHWGSELNAIMYYGVCFLMLDIVRDKKRLYALFSLITASAVIGLARRMYYLAITSSTADSVTINQVLIRLRGDSVLALLMFIISVSFAVTLPAGRKKILFAALSFFFGAIQLSSFSRSVWIAAVFGLAFLFFVSLGKEKSNFLKWVLAGVLLTSLYLALALSVPTDNFLFRSASNIAERYESIFKAREEPSIVTRGSEWEAAKDKALEHPFLGNGLGAEVTYFRYDRWFTSQTWYTTRYIHNIYLFLFLNMGILGLIVFLWFCLAFLKYGLSVYRSLGSGMDKALSLGIVSGFASLMVVSLAGPFLFSPMFTMWLGFFIGALVIIDKSRNTREA